MVKPTRPGIFFPLCGPGEVGPRPNFWRVSSPSARWRTARRSPRRSAPFCQARLWSRPCYALPCSKVNKSEWHMNTLNIISWIYIHIYCHYISLYISLYIYHYIYIYISWIYIYTHVLIYHYIPLYIIKNHYISLYIFKNHYMSLYVIIHSYSKYH